jgi:carbon storage regulator
MLVLSRKRNESVVIEQYGIRVTVVEVRQGKVRLGFEAPAGVIIHREELQDRLSRRRELENDGRAVPNCGSVSSPQCEGLPPAGNA